VILAILVRLNIRGHRDFSNTDCPGDWLYSQLPRLRKQVADKLGLQFTPEELENSSPVVDLKFGSTGSASHRTTTAIA
jgi:hypothetical protein